ncbi:hypothetical protein BsWGS_23141 [Bradybaena similaris]
MALNYVPLSQCVNLFVANQFRTTNPLHRCYSKYVLPWVPANTLQFRCRGNKRVLCLQTSLCCWRDGQHFTTTPPLYNPHTSLVRAKYMGNKAGSGPEQLPFMSKTGKNKKVPRVKSCPECGKKISSTDKPKFNRQTVVPSPAPALNADLQSHTLLKPPKGKKSGGAPNEVLVSNVAKEMVDYFNKFIDCLNKVDNTVRLQKVRSSTGISKYTDGSIPLILPVREEINPRKTSNLAADVKMKRPKTAGKKAQSENKKNKPIETDNIVEKANPELNQISRETCPPKNSVRERELLEIRPKFVENVQADKSFNNCKMTHATTESKNEPNKEIKTDAHKDGFILVEQKITNIVENKVEPKNPEGNNQDGIPCNETGFILLYPEEGKRDQSSVYRSQSEEKGFILVSDKEKCDYGQRRSKEDNRNFVVVNDNPFCNPRSTRTSPDESETSQVSNAMGVLPRPDIQVQPLMVEKKTLGCASLNSKYEGSAVNRISRILDNQAIGSSDSKEELKRQGKTVGDVKTQSVVDHEGQNSAGALQVQSLNPEPHRWMSKSKLEDAGPKTSKEVENKILSKGKVATCKYTDDSSKGINTMNDEGANTRAIGTANAGAIKPEANATKNGDIATVKKGDIKKANRQFQGGMTESKSAHDLHVDAFGNAIKGHLKLNLEPAMENKKSGKKGVSRTNSFANLVTNERPKSPTKETSPSIIKVGHETNMGSLKKLHTNTLAPSGNTVDRNSCTTRHQRSPASVVHELKPDLLQKKRDRRSPKVNVAVAKAGLEPLLFVKPEEMSSKTKIGSRSETRMLYSVEQHISPIIASPTYSSLAKNPIEESFASAPKSMLDAKEELQQLYKTHSQEINKRDKNVTSEQDKNQTAPTKASNETMGFSSACSEARSDQVPKVMTLTDVFRQLRHTKDMKLARPSPTRTNNFYAMPVKSRNPRKNDELVRSIRQQWSRDFQEKWRNLQPISLYRPCGGKCSPDAAQNSNSSAGSRRKKDKKVSPSVEGKSKHGPPPTANMVQVNRKSEHLPTMGMAERLLAASQKPSRTPETNPLSPNIKGSEMSNSSHNTDATITKGTAEIDEFPEVDQFEEWIQNKMPEILNDNKEKTTSTEEIKEGLSPNTPTKDGLKLSYREPVDDIRIYEGSNVDGDFLTQTSIQQPKTSNPAEPAIDNKQLYNSTKADKINYGHPDTNILDTSGGTHPKALIGEPSASKTDTSVRSRPSADGAFLCQDRYSNNDNLTETTSSASEVCSAMNISPRGPSKPTSPTTNTGRGAKGVSLSKSTKLKSLDGFASMTVIEAPQKSPSKNLKPSLKRSPSRERSVEKRVSFEKIAQDDSSKLMERYNKQFDRYVGSPVDPYRAEDNFADGNNSKEINLRSDLAQERKRAEMEARIKLLNEHSKQIREYEAVLSKYRDIVTKFRDDALKVIRGRGKEEQKSSEV